MRRAGPPDAASLEAAARSYLDQRVTSRAHLGRLLKGRVTRWDRAHPEEIDVESLFAAISALLDRLVADGWLNDAAYAGSRARTLTRFGRSNRKIQATLATKGLTGALVSEALADRGPDAEREAARSYVRKRRMGHWGDAETRAERAPGELNKLGRAGFPFALARSVLEEEPEGEDGGLR